VKKVHGDALGRCGRVPSRKHCAAKCILANIAPLPTNQRRVRDPNISSPPRHNHTTDHRSHSRHLQNASLWLDFMTIISGRVHGTQPSQISPQAFVCFCQFYDVASRRAKFVFAWYKASQSRGVFRSSKPEALSPFKILVSQFWCLLLFEVWTWLFEYEFINFPVNIF